MLFYSTPFLPFSFPSLLLLLLVLLRRTTNGTNGVTAVDRWQSISKYVPSCFLPRYTTTFRWINRIVVLLSPLSDVVDLCCSKFIIYYATERSLWLRFGITSSTRPSPIYLYCIEDFTSTEISMWGPRSCFVKFREIFFSFIMKYRGIGRILNKKR